MGEFELSDNSIKQGRKALELRFYGNDFESHPKPMRSRQMIREKWKMNSYAELISGQREDRE